VDINDIEGPGVDAWVIARLRDWGITALTDIQVRALKAGVANGQSMIVSAPTSSGKTLVGELAALTALRNNKKVIYLVSHKALADQKYLDFLRRFGEQAEAPLATVALSTGDRDEGEVDAQLIVATYEKALGLLLAGQLRSANSLVIADELQILREPGRGPEIETLCAALRQRSIGQFVALTATVENADDLAGWMECELVRSSHRDVPLHQEIWYSNQTYRTTFGQETGSLIDLGVVPNSDAIAAVNKLIELGRTPVLVFTESRREAADLATAFGESRPRVGHGIAMAEQLELFSEPTDSSDRLKKNAERQVTFHSADLTPQERQVIETGISGSHFDVCFATSTLAAGVNFPFRSIVFPKLTYNWGDRGGTRITRWDYRNMSGRAGRLGMHPDGFAVLLPKNGVELAHANNLVLPENDRLESQLVALSLRKTILTLIASNLASTLPEVMEFFRNTLYWYQTLENNAEKLSAIETKSREAIKWLIDNKLLTDVGGDLFITQLGKGAASSGLLPTTAVFFADLIKKYTADLDGAFDEWMFGVIHAACSSDEFRGKHPTRFFPFQRQSYDSMPYLAAKNLLVPLDRADIQLAQSAHAISLYISGMAERKIAHVTNISSGNLHRLSTDVAWVLEGFHKLTCVPELHCPQAVSNNMSMLARMVRWGAPPETLDVMRVAERHRVPGFGRQRAMALLGQGISTLHDVLSTAKDKLIDILRNDRRADALVEAISSAVGIGPSRLAATHERVAKELGLDDLVGVCNTTNGVEYEKAIAELLKVETSWVVTILDDGVRQNVPDLMITLGQSVVLLECKTCTKSPPLIKKEEAWAVLQKAADFDKDMRRVTLGKPVFDETSKKKAAASHDITLVEHTVFVEALLRVHSGSLPPEDFMEWLGASGVADIERLGGKATFQI